MAKRVKSSATNGAGDELIVNLDEFAALCAVTPETLRSHLAEAPAKPDWMIQRGRRGVGYKLKAAGALDWWRNRGSEDTGVDDSRRRQLAELRMQMLGGDAAEEDLQLTGKQRREEYLAGAAELSYREAMGELCRSADVDAELANAAIELRRHLQAVGRVIRRRFALSKEVETAIDDLIGTRLEEFARKLDVEDDSSGDAGGGASAVGQPVAVDAPGKSATSVRRSARARPKGNAGSPVPGEADTVASGEPAPRASKPRRVQRPVAG